MLIITKNEIAVLKKVLYAVFCLIDYEPELGKYTEGDSCVILLDEDEMTNLEKVKSKIDVLDEGIERLMCEKVRA